MSAAGSRRFAQPKAPKVIGGIGNTPDFQSASDTRNPGQCGPPLTIQFKIAQGDQILFESTPAEFHDLAKLISSIRQLGNPSIHESINPPPVPLPSSISHLPSSTLPSPLFALLKGLGTWTLIFNGEQTILKHERGIFYVVWLLTHPGETIHALDLAAKIPEIYRRQLGLAEITDPATGKVVPLQSGARLQERSLALDDAQAMRAILRKEKELESILDDDSASEPEKAEALRELEAIAQFQRQHGQRSRDNAQRAADSIRKSIKRFHRHLVQAGKTDTHRNSVFTQFAEHIGSYILVPWRPSSGHGNRYARTGLAGCFTYEPPPSAILWAI